VIGLFRFFFPFFPAPFFLEHGGRTKRLLLFFSFFFPSGKRRIGPSRKFFASFFFRPQIGVASSLFFFNSALKLRRSSFSPKVQFPPFPEGRYGFPHDGRVTFGRWPSTPLPPPPLELRRRIPPLSSGSNSLTTFFLGCFLVSESTNPFLAKVFLCLFVWKDPHSLASFFSHTYIP